MKSRTRTPSKLSRSISQRLDAYAVAAAGHGDVCGPHIGSSHHSHWPHFLGGVGMLGLGLGVPAEAKIVYTPANYLIQAGSSRTNFYPLDLNQDGIADVVFNAFCGGLLHPDDRGGCKFGVAGGAGNGIEVGTKGHGWARAMKIGAHIGPAKQFKHAALMAYRWQSGHSSTRTHGTSGYWFNSEPRYLGVAFQIEGKTHYGWVRLKNSSDAGARVTGYAYETIPGRSMKAGHKKSSEGPGFEGPNTSLGHSIPRECSGSLGALAMGSAGRLIGQR